MNPIENWHMMVLEVMQRKNVQTSSHFKPRLFLDRSIVHRLFISGLEPDSFFFFLHGLFVLEYADSFSQRDFFRHCLLVARICPVKSVENA